MATEITTAGYQSIRDFIQANWKYIELRDGVGSPIIRIGIGDARVTWTHLANAQTLKLQIVVKGSDSELSALLPKTFASSAIYAVSTAGTTFAVESFSNFTMEASGDELTVIHQLEIPQVI